MKTAVTGSAVRRLGLAEHLLSRRGTRFGLIRQTSAHSLGRVGI
jgi:hypothetical protein